MCCASPRRGDSNSIGGSAIRSSRTSRVLLTILLAAPLLWLLGRPAIADRWLAFRDAANYYQPLFVWETHEWGAGRIPLWNPHDNCGTPAVADATSSVFYPGKLLFLLPIPQELRFHLYVTLHVVLAAGAAYGLARRWSCSHEAALLAGLTYALGGNVLFQTCNVVFLVGAAWLPLAVLGIDRLLRRRAWTAAVGLGAVLALMTLGGDPQMAYHVMLGALLYATILTWRSRRGKSTEPTDSPVPGRDWRRSYVALLAGAASCGILLAAVQIFPSCVWTQVSDRAMFTHPRSLSEFAGRLCQSNIVGAELEDGDTPLSNAFWNAPEQGTHHADAYQFSVGPWRLVETIWPNLYGSTWPVNRRWISALPAEGRVWTPSMYQGLLPLLLALSCLRLRSTCVRQQWLTWCLLLAVLASFGWYGIGWVIHEFRFAWDDAAAETYVLGPQVGGLYWLMSSVLPGYVYFRYPAKLMVIAALAISLLAAVGWDKAWRGPTRLPRRLLALGALSFVLAALTWFSKASFLTWAAAAPIDQLFGPLDGNGAYQGLLRAFLHTALLCLALRSFLRQATTAPTTNRATLFRRLALVATVGEIVLANSSLLVTVPGATLRASTSPIGEAIHADARLRGSEVTPRAYRDVSLAVPRSWRTTSAPDRLSQVVAWERDTLLPKHHLVNDVALIESFSTLSAGDFRMFMREARQFGPHPAGLSSAPSRNVLNLLSARYFILPRTGANRQSSDVPTAVARHNPGSFPRAWVVHRVEQLPPLHSKDPRVLRRRARAVLSDRGQPRNFADIAVVESDIEVPLPNRRATSMSTDDHGREGGELCRIITQTPQRTTIRCQLETAGLLVVNDLYYPGWRAYRRRPDQAHKTELDIHRANRVLRAVYLPEGDHVVEFVYRPWEFFTGAAVSLAAWLAVLGWWAGGRLRARVRARRRRPIASPDQTTSPDGNV